MTQPNPDFMHWCELCGNNELALSEITLKCGYGSKYDGEALTLSVCGECMDYIFKTLLSYPLHRKTDEKCDKFFKKL